MCGRYALYDFQDLYDEYSVPKDFAMSPTYNVAPTQTMHVITRDGMQMMRWGLIPGWAKDEKIGYRLINTRSESIFEKPLWKSLITKTRCLIPANGFYEWQKRADGKQPYFIHLQDGRMFMFAGVWTRWHHNHRAWQTYSILTTTPKKEMTPIHDRMPAILHKDDEDHWLLADQREDIEPLLSPYDGKALQLFEVDRAVNVATVNDQTLILPINSA